MTHKQAKKDRKENRKNQQEEQPRRFNLEQEEKEELIFLNFQDKSLRLQLQSLDFYKQQLNQRIKVRLLIKDTEATIYNFKVIDLMGGIVEIVSVPKPKPLPKKDEEKLEDKLKKEVAE